MLFRKETWPGLADGSITVALRWWRRPTVKAGGTLQSPAGLLAIDAVDVVEVADLTDADATAAGFDSLAALLAELDRARSDQRRLHRIAFHHLGDDPRLALRADDDLDGDAIADLTRRLGRLDARAERPWTRAALQAIDRHPGVVSTVLAADAGVDRPTFKQRIRRLKALGLTESLDVGYRLSPRGVALLARLEA